MTWLVIDQHRIVSLATDDPLIAAQDISAFDDVRALLAGIDAISLAAETRGYAKGLADGRAVAAAEHTTALMALDACAATARAALRAEAGDLAIAIIRRIAAEIGPAATVAGLAASAAADLAPDAPAQARVHPSAVAATVARLGGQPQVTVVADAGLSPTDCVLITANGSIRAGLDTQLTVLAAALVPIVGNSIRDRVDAG
jgi:type III secretion protein L